MQLQMLLVDDEEMLTQSLTARIRHIGDERVGEIHTARSGEEALQLLNRLDIDVMIVDMVMPGMSGLDLIRTAAETGHDCQSIVLSGHDNYILIRESFKAGTVDYLLKPVSSVELKLVLEKAFKRAEANRRRRHMLMPALASRLMQALEGAPVDRWVDELSALGFAGRMPHSMFHVACVQDSERAQCLLGALMGRFLQGAVEWAMLSHQEVLFLLVNHRNEDISAIEALAMQLPPLFERVAFSDLAELPRGLYRAIQQMFDVYTGRILYPNGAYLLYTPPKGRGSLISRDQLRTLFETEPRLVCDLVEELIDRNLRREAVGELSIKDLETFYHQILNRLDIIAGVRPHPPLTGFHTLEELSNFLREQNEQVRQSLLHQSGASVIDVAIRYVQEHYAEEIDMRAMAGRLNMNYTYFSEQFKRVTGENFSAYLLRVRMLKAKRLLEDPMRRIQDIADQVGYDSAKNMTRAFKKYFGLSPSEYRQGKAEGRSMSNSGT